MSKKKDLVQIIRDNPGCVAIVDNDCWTLYKQSPYTPPEGVAEDVWLRDNELANDGDVKRLGDGGYGSGNCYGGDILQALAVIVGIKIESV
jgi:hypothetical protein